MPDEHEQIVRHGCTGTIEPDRLFFGWTDADKIPYGTDDKGRRVVGMQGMLPLLQTCRFVYAEAIVLLYKTPMFMINGLTTLLDWRECVLAERFAAVRALDLRYSMSPTRLEFRRQSLKIHGWQEFWEAARCMEGLRWLRVTVRGRQGRYSWRDEEKMFEPLDQLRQVPDFEVLVSWGIFDDGDDSAVYERKQRPFRLVRSNCCLSLVDPAIDPAIHGYTPDIFGRKAD